MSKLTAARSQAWIELFTDFIHRCMATIEIPNLAYEVAATMTNNAMQHWDAEFPAEAFEDKRLEDRINAMLQQAQDIMSPFDPNESLQGSIMPDDDSHDKWVPPIII